MEGNPNKTPESQVRSRETEDVATKRPWRRNEVMKHVSLVFQMHLSCCETLNVLQQQASENPNRKIHEKKRRRRRTRRRKKSVSDVTNEITEEDEVEETTSSSTPGDLSSNKQRLRAEDRSQKEEQVQQHQKDAKMVEAQTQTRKHNGKNRYTQTQVVFQKNQQTQTDVHVTTQGDTQSGSGGPAETQQEPDKPGPEVQNAARTPLKLSERPVKDEVSSQSKPEETDPSSGVTQPEKDAKPASYATVVSGDGAGGVGTSRPADKTSPNRR